MKRRSFRNGLLFLCAALACFAARAETPAAERLDAAAVPSSYRLQPGDVLEVSVWKEDDLRREVLVRTDGTGIFLSPRAAMFDGVRDLDGARLEHALARTHHEVTYQHGVQLVVDMVTSGQAKAGVLIRPVTVREIQRTADVGLLMPPKSTFFTPKLRTGPVIRPLDV